MNEAVLDQGRVTAACDRLGVGLDGLALATCGSLIASLHPWRERITVEVVSASGRTVVAVMTSLARSDLAALASPAGLQTEASAADEVLGRCVVGSAAATVDEVPTVVASEGPDGVRLSLLGVDAPGWTGAVRRVIDLVADGDRVNAAAWADVNGPLPSGDGGPPARLLAPVHELVRATARRHPARVAIESGEAALTYAELDAGSDAIAASLLHAGVERGDRVGLLLERGADLVVALVGVLKAGAAYIGLDPSFPQARLALVLEDAAPRAVLIHRTLTDRLPKEGPPVLDVRSIRGAPTALPEVGLDDVAYLIFTSGSTGRPKGIVQLHRSISNLVAWQDERSTIRFERVLQFASIGFDVHLQELFSTFAQGGTLVTITPEDQIDPDRLARLVERHRVGTLFLTVSALTQLLARPDRVRAIEMTVTDLVVAGEQLHIGGQLEAFLRSHPDVRLHNHYGVSESHVVTAATFDGRGELPVRAPVGRPIAGSAIQILGPDRRPVPFGVVGEAWIAGSCLARGYVNDEQTRARFHDLEGRRWYQTGDLARWSAAGDMEFVSRRDDQVKIRGRLVELGDVESALAAVEGVREAVVGVRESASGERILVGWYSLHRPQRVDAVRRRLRETLPDFMVPAVLVEVDRFRVGPTGKVDRLALVVGERKRPELDVVYRPPSAATEVVVAEVLASLLDVDRVGIDDSFFDLGATSLTLTLAAEHLTERLDRPVATLDLFRHATTRALAAHLHGVLVPRTVGRSTTRRRFEGDDGRVAIIGMALRVPGASTPGRLWERLLAGDDCLKEFGEGELAEPLLLPTGERGRAVRRLGVIEEAEEFDCELFGFSPRDAAWLDPQHRVLLECAWEALESAGELPDRPDRRVGIFGGSEINTHIFRLGGAIESMVDYLHALTSTDKDFVTSRVAYTLGMRGPAVTVQTACSTSLVAVHMARQSLLNGECDVALAGGVSLQLPQHAPHLFEEGLIYSSDGRTRPFDVSAAGTNITNGAVLVVLKRLEHAVSDGNEIVAVIRGSAINNDGRRKVGYAAPSVDGQVEVIVAAIADAGVSADDIAFIEAHGTATAIGDAVEVEALTRAFHGQTERSGHCILGSVKGNVGHLNRAAGAAGLVKAALALRSRIFPGTCHFRGSNPSLGLDRTPFVVSSDPVDLSTLPGTLRCGVSSFGIGGTNAHVVLEEWVGPAPERTDGGPEVVVLSGRTPAAAISRALALANELDRRADLDLASVARTCSTGRVALPHRVAVTADSPGQLAISLREVREEDVRKTPDTSPSIAFLFPGQGGDLCGAAAAVAARFPVFRLAIDDLCEAAVDEAGIDPRDALLATRVSAALRARARTSLWNQLSAVAVGRATSLLLTSWGIVPAAVAGHSTGEYTAACVSGALGLREAVRVVAARARLMDEVAERGGMTSVALPVDEALALVVPGVHLAALNSRTHTVFAGRTEALDRLEAALAAVGVPFRRLDNHNPNHSPLMASMAPELARVAATTQLQGPTVPLLGGATGSWVGTADPVEHWVTHLVSPVRLADCFDRIAEAGITIVVDAGPHAWMSTLSDYHFAGTVRAVALHGGEPDDAVQSLLDGIGRLWTLGVDVDWDAVHTQRPGRLVPLPTYPFERRPVPTPDMPARPERSSAPALLTRVPVAEWTYRTVWARTRRPIRAEPDDVARVGTLVQIGPDDAATLWTRLERAGLKRATEADVPSLALDAPVIALADLRSAAGAAAVDDVAATLAGVGTAVVRLVDAARGRQIRLWLLTEGAVAADGPAAPRSAALGALALVVPQEHPVVEVVHVDAAGIGDDDLARLLLAEICNGGEEGVIALRTRGRLVPRHESVALTDTGHDFDWCGGTIIVTGGLGRVGAEVARHFGTTRNAHVVLVGRTPLSDDDDSRVGVRRERFDTLRSSLGDRVSYFVADVTDRAQLAAAIGAAEQIGSLRGIIHAAAADIESDEFLTFVAEGDEHKIRRQLRSKLLGVQAIDAVLGDRPLELRVLFSSLATVLGGLGYVAYTAAAMEGGAGAGRGERTVVHWDVWRAASAGVLGSTHRGVDMEPGEALGLLDAILAAGLSDVLVSTVDLGARRAAIATRLDATDEAYATKAPSADPMEVAREAWERALGQDGFGGDANFFCLGGDSLTGLRVVLDVNERLGTSVSPGDILRTQTFDEFVARVLDRCVVLLSAATHAAAGPGNGATAVSPLQHRWFHMANRGFGNLDAPFIVRGSVDPALLQQALHEVIRRHDVLRSTFRVEADDVVQVAHDTWRPILSVTDARDSANPRQTVAGIADALAEPPFDLGSTPPFRAALVLLEPQMSLLLVRTHHIVFDGWSAAVLVEELDACYAALADGSAPALPKAPQYSAFAAAFNGHLAGDGIRATRRFWQQLFRGAPGPVRLPHRPDADGGLTGAKVLVTAPAHIGEALKVAAQEQRTTVFSLFVAAFGLLLAEVTGERDLVFGTTFAGRFADHGASTVGVFVNPLPMRLRLDGVDSASRYLDHVREVLLGMQEHQRYVLADLVRHVEPFVGVDINETFATYILFQNQPRPQSTLLSWTVLETDGRIADPVLGVLEASSTRALMREIELIVYAADDGSYDCNIWYRTGLFDRRQVEGWASRFIELLGSIATSEREVEPWRPDTTTKQESHS